MFFRTLPIQYSTWWGRSTGCWWAAAVLRTLDTNPWQASLWPEVWQISLTFIYHFELLKWCNIERVREGGKKKEERWDEKWEGRIEREMINWGWEEREFPLHAVPCTRAGEYTFLMNYWLFRVSQENETWYWVSVIPTVCWTCCAQAALTGVPDSTVETLTRSV